jgi:oligopeptide transport system substrate-binding protein
MRILLLCIILTFFGGCSRPSIQTDKLTVNLFTEPPSLDPTLLSDMTSMNVVLQLFEGLTRFDENEKAQPALAKSIETSKDLLTYTFKLRESKWSDGSPLTSRDFKEAWALILKPGYPAPFAYKLYDIKNAEQVKKGELPVEELGVETPDDHTLIVHLRRPTPHFLELLPLATFYPLPIKHIQAHPNWAGDAGPHYVSNGPFTLKEWAHVDHIVLEKNPHYWDAENVKLEEIEMLMINDPTTEYSLFEAGEIQWTGLPLSALPQEVMVEMKGAGKLNTMRSNAVEFLLLNTEAFPLTNVHIRRALSYAINRKELVDHVLQNDQEVALALTPPNQNREAFKLFQDHDVKAAQEEFEKGLKELKLTKKNFPKLSYMFNTSPGSKRVSEVMQRQWQKVLGVDTSLENTDWKIYIPKVTSGDYQIARMGWVGEYRDPMAFLYTFNEPIGEENNITRFNDAEFNKWMELATTANDYKKRKEALDKAETRLIEQMPIIPLFYSNLAYLISPHLKGVNVNSLFMIDFKEAYLTP